MSSVFIDNVDALTDYWVDFDWPARWNKETHKSEEDDPLGLQEDGWVWIGQEGENLLAEIDDFRAVVSNLKIVAKHPFISNNEVFQLLSYQSEGEDKAAVYYGAVGS